MKTRTSLAALTLLFTALTAVAAEKPKTDAPVAPTPDTESAEAGKENKKKMIEKGMNAEQITELFGKPAEIKPIESPAADTKAEQWIYRRKIKDTTVQVAVGTRMVATYSGPAGGGQMVDRPEPIYRPKVVSTYQVTALLMVNGKLEVAKQWAEQDDALQ